MLDFIKNILYIIYNTPFSCLCFLISIFGKKKNAIFVNCFDGKSFGDNPKAILDAAYSQGLSIETYWLDISGNKSNGNTFYIKPNSIKSIYYMSVCKIWISNVRMPYYSYKSKKTTYINTWHGGLSIKKIEGECQEKLSQRYIMQAKHDSKLIDYIISECEDMSRLYNQYFWINNPNILKIGSPRNDIFFRDNEKLLKTLVTKFSIQGKKILLYAPTFRNSSYDDLYDVDFDTIRKTLNKKFGNDWIVMLRYHPRFLNSRELSNKDNCINVTSYPDIQELLVLADVLITDYSSTCLDFILTKKPVFIYAKDIKAYEKERGFHLDLNMCPFSVSENNLQLENHILNFDLEKYKKDIQIFIEQHGYYSKGESSIKIVNMIQRLLNEDNNHE